jgi:hypothetical protein
VSPDSCCSYRTSPNPVPHSIDANRLSVWGFKLGSVAKDVSDQRGLREGNGDWRAQLDDLTDRLIEKRERFQYFIVTASTAVLVFTFNNFNQPDGILRLGPRWLVIVGWFALLLAAAAALLQIALRHERYWRYIKTREAGAVRPRDDEEQGWVDVTRKIIVGARWAMAILFVAGVGCLTTAAAVAI